MHFSFLFLIHDNICSLVAVGFEMIKCLVTSTGVSFLGSSCFTSNDLPVKDLTIALNIASNFLFYYSKSATLSTKQTSIRIAGLIVFFKK